jgi:hypothetical protein
MTRWTANRLCRRAMENLMFFNVRRSDGIANPASGKFLEVERRAMTAHEIGTREEWFAARLDLLTVDPSG